VKPALKQLHWLPVKQRITYKLRPHLIHSSFSQCKSAPFSHFVRITYVTTQTMLHQEMHRNSPHLALLAVLVMFAKSILKCVMRTTTTTTTTILRIWTVWDNMCYEKCVINYKIKQTKNFLPFIQSRQFTTKTETSIKIISIF